MTVLPDGKFRKSLGMDLAGHAFVKIIKQWARYTLQYINLKKSDFRIFSSGNPFRVTKVYLLKGY